MPETNTQEDGHNNKAAHTQSFPPPQREQKGGRNRQSNGYNRGNDDDDKVQNCDVLMRERAVEVGRDGSCVCV